MTPNHRLESATVLSHDLATGSGEAGKPNQISEVSSRSSRDLRSPVPGVISRLQALVSTSCSAILYLCLWVGDGNSCSGSGAYHRRHQALWKRQRCRPHRYRPAPSCSAQATDPLGGVFWCCRFGDAFGASSERALVGGLGTGYRSLTYKSRPCPRSTR